MYHPHNNKMRRYRIVRDKYLGYECQIWRWYFPFWCQMWLPGYISNTFSSVEKAEEFIYKHKNNTHKVVKYL